MTTTNAPTRHGRRRRRIIGAVAALAMMSGVAAMTSGTAEAALMTVYLHPIQIQSGGVCTARIGVDIAMSEADAHAFIAHPGEEATAKLWADDQWYDNALIAIPTDSPTWPQAWSGGYSVEYTRTFSCNILNEDGWTPWEVAYFDEIYAQITFQDFRTGRTHRANSAVHIYEF